MRDRAIVGDTLESPAERWPTIAYVFATVSFLGIVASSLLLVTGSESVASHVATLTAGITFLQSSMMESFGRPGSAANNAAAPEYGRALRLGQKAGLGFLFVCYLIVKWTTGDTVVLQEDQLTTVFFVTVAIILAVPPTSLLWRTRP
jgi:hypothetical protein